MIRYVLIIVLLLCPLTGFAQSRFDLDTATHNAQWFMIGADLGTTWYGIQKDYRHEANPLLVAIAKPFDPKHRMVVQSSAVIGMSIVSDYTNHKIFNTNPKIRIFLRSVVLGVHAFAVYNNLK